MKGSLREALAYMAPGVQRCMYCGDSLGADIDHFDPLSRSPLRTFDWLNHLLACSVCNSHQKRDLFPVDDKGRPLLIDPTSEDPFDHLLLSLSVGEYRALTPKGTATIQVFGLNRALLVRGREQARRVVVASLRGWARARARDDESDMEECVLTIREQPFADVCHAMLRQSDVPRAEIVFGRDSDVLPTLRDPRLRACLAR
ncbi:HNH endonuclease [Actinokineospora sp.]|uniref:HNH endonuclease n=1 Tax=Actinokineospora sp. TaxID=1872133 RepID=UPI003D6BFEFA